MFRNLQKKYDWEIQGNSIWENDRNANQFAFNYCQFIKENTLSISMYSVTCIHTVCMLCCLC